MATWAITGGSGFAGAHLARELLARGRHVRTLDRVPLPPSLAGACEALSGDVREPALCRRLCRGADVVVHAAAALPACRSRSELRSVNVDGTASILAAAADAGVERVVFVSSGVVYGVGRPRPATEDDPASPIDPYGASKVEAEQLCAAFGRRGLPTVVLRPQAVIGPERLGAFGILFRWVCESRRIYTLGDGRNRYQLLAVEDLVAGILAAAERPVAGSTFNLGAARIGTVRADLEALVEHAGSASRIVPIPAAPARLTLRALDAARLSPLSAWHYESADRDCVVSIEQARARLGWEPSRSNADVLREAFDWYSANPGTAVDDGTHRAPWREGALALVRRLS